MGTAWSYSSLSLLHFYVRYVWRLAITRNPAECECSMSVFLVLFVGGVFASLRDHGTIVSL